MFHELLNGIAAQKYPQHTMKVKGRAREKKRGIE